MSPGLTFERVYRELKFRLAEGLLKPGEPIEPATLRDELAASITPIRDALHRLTGERLVDAPNHNGFRVPRPSEAELRDLYLWRGQLLTFATGKIALPVPTIAEPLPPEPQINHATAALFAQIASASGSPEQLRAVTQLNDRIAPYWRAEAQALSGFAEEHDRVAALLQAGERIQLKRVLQRYHERRATAVPEILAAAASYPA